jgi:hypothetical protein
MEQLTLTQAVNEISQALATLEVAKEECKDVIEATLDAYYIVPAENMSKEELNEVKAARKIEKKNILKLAKAMMQGAKEEAREEAENMASLIEELG